MKHVHLPRNLDALWPILETEPDTGIYAGGTDYLVRMRKGFSDPPSLTCLERIEELKGVRDKRDEIGIGAAATYTHLLSDTVVRDHFPVLTQAIQVLGSPHIRNMGTIGGNVITASPAGDCLPPLYVMEAELELVSKGGTRRVAINRFIKGAGSTDLAPGEILSCIWLDKKNAEYNIHHYEKAGQRKALSCAVVSLAAVIKTDATGIIEDVRFAWGSVGPTVIRSPEAEAVLKKKPLSQAALMKSAGMARAAVQPIDDVRGSAEYRRLVAGNLLLRLMPYASPSQNSAAGAGTEKDRLF